MAGIPPWEQLAFPPLSWLCCHADTLENVNTMEVERPLVFPYSHPGPSPYRWGWGNGASFCLLLVGFFSPQNYPETLSCQSWVTGSMACLPTHHLPSIRTWPLLRTYMMLRSWTPEMKKKKKKMTEGAGETLDSNSVSVSVCWMDLSAGGDLRPRSVRGEV